MLKLKLKCKRLRARAARAWDTMFGSHPSTRQPSPRPPYPTSYHPDPPFLASAPPPPERSAPVPLAEAADSQMLSRPTTSPPQEPLLTESPSVLWGRLSDALRGLHKSSSLFPPLQRVIGDLILCIEMVEQTEKNKKEFKEFTLQLTALSESLGRRLEASKSATMSDAILNTTLSIQKQVGLIRSRQDCSAGRRLVEAEQDGDEIIKCYRQIQALFNQLEIDANLSVWSIANERIANTRLKELEPAKMATHDSRLSTEIGRRKCTKETRTGVLSNLDTWSNDPHAPNVYWMNGMAGTGKTTIATTFADTLKERKQLAASFFCTRMSAECQDVTRIVPTIAYQLARYSTPFQSALCRMLGSDRDLGSSLVSTQFQRLLKEPLLEVKDVIPEGLVVVIDALDECTAPKGVELMLDMLFRAAGDLPLKFFLTSRPEPVIWNKIHNQPDTTRSVFVLHDIEESLVQSDIELYLQDELYPKIITPLQLKQLAKLAGRLFIYATTVVRYIKIGEKTGDLERRLKTMLSVTAPSERKHAAIDQLYESIISAATGDESFEEQEKDCMRLVLWTVVCAREPISVETLTALAGVNDQRTTLAMLQPLRSVLYLSEDNNLVTTLHASLPGFLFDATRSSTLFCDTKHHNQLLTQGCFGIMKRQLRFNICGLESSYIPDKKVPYLEARVAKAVSSSLAYACRYWADHLREAAVSADLCGSTQEFLSERLLFWMEVMNLKGWIQVGGQALLMIKQWLVVNSEQSQLLGFAEDAQRFVTSYAATAVSQCTPHIYVSALPLSGHASTVFKCYWGRTRGLLRINGIGFNNGSAALLALWESNSEVKSLAYSPDGTCIAIGYGDGGIIVKDILSGTVVCAPFDRHTGPVRSVNFSSDGSRIVSGSSDHTIRIWDITEETPSGRSLEGHSGGVSSVVFSPDGTYVISGSGDRTIRIWSVQDGTLVAPPLVSLTHGVNSVALSPDGRHIVSGSNDCTVSVWDARDGSPIGDLIHRHSGYVTSVAFSPDGARIASGSSDFEVRLWHALDRSPIHTPLMGHTDWIRSVAFSPDSRLVVSGSDDCTVRVWDARDGTPVGDPFQGHSGYVNSVAFSPDGACIVSGSDDCTVRFWNMPDSISISAHIKKHAGQITSVALSPDGAHLVTGSNDHTIRIWNMQDGTPAGTPFAGHVGYIRSVAFSYDGTCVASGSDDRTVRIWDARRSACLGTPFVGHTDYVRSVAFSPDDSRIASGSSDCTVRVWSRHNGTLLYAPCKGHTGYVTSVAFARAGELVISGSDDCTIRVWDAQNGTLVGVPFQGHTDWILSIALSPDGTRVASGSDDRTIRVWNLQDGTLVAPPIESHTGGVASVAFSPDGTRIVSGSDDCTVRVWDAHDGSPIGNPFQGHSDRVTSVAFLPDSTRIVSGSYDGSIRIWDRGGDTHAIDKDVWKVLEDGWVVGSNSRLLFWVPPQLMGALPTPHNPWVTGIHGPISVEYADLLLGDSWPSCYA